MRFGISAAALILEDRGVLLVRHQEPGRYDFWLPPGGGLKGDESIFDCAKREALEETGLRVELGRIVYGGYCLRSSNYYILCRRGLPGPRPVFLNNALVGTGAI